MHILHVEDDTAFALFVKHELKKSSSDIEIEHVSSLHEAKLAIKNKLTPYDIILLDLRLPDAEGLQSLDELLIFCEQVPIIVLSGEGERKVGIESLARGAQDYLLKENCNGELLHRAIEYTLGRLQQKKLLKSRLDQMELVIKSTGIGTWDWYIQTGECEINAQWADIVGYDIQELLPFNIDKLLNMMPEEDVISTRQALEQHWRGETSIYRAEYQLKHKKGHLIWVEDTGRVIERDRNGLPLRMVGTHLDITSRRATQNQIKKLSRIASESINGVIITDVEGKVEWINKGFERITGYTLEESLGRKPKDLLAGEKTDAEISRKMGQAIARREGFHVEIINYHKSGREYWIDIQCSPLFDDNGDMQGFMAIETDITKEKEVALKLERQRQMLEQMSELGRIGAWEVDLLKGEVYWSAMTKEIHEVPEDYQPLLDTAINFYKEGYSRTRIQELVSACIETGKPFHAELQMVSAKQREIWIATRGRSEFVDGVCIGIFGSFQEITEKKRTEALLIKAKESAQAGEKIKGEFLASMSHEIRTPINGVIGMLNLLDRTELDQSQKRQVNLANQSAQSLLTVINDILDFSKIEAGKIEIETIDFDLYEHMASFAQSIAIKAFEKKLEFVIDLHGLDTQWVKGDPNRLRQVLNNLASNAIKFTAEGEILVKFQSQRREGLVLLTVDVVDTGIGISEQKIKNLFSPFSQADSSTTREYGGTGLGLAISRQLCNLMNGDVSIQSQEGKGSHFSFTVTFSECEKSNTPLPSLDLNNLTILIVDDNQTNRHSLRHLFHHWGANVLEAADGIDAIHTLSTHLTGDRMIDLVLIDQTMPVLDGLTLAKQIQSKPAFSSIPLVLMSSLTTLRSTEELKGLGFIAQLNKPLDIQEVINILVLSFPVLGVVQDDAVSLRQSDTVEKNGHKLYLSSDKTILLVEDNLINQEVVKGFLHAYSISVLTAENGIEAIEILKTANDKENIALILMDCFMPVMDGYEATQCIRKGQAGEQFKAIPIIAMTANAMKEDRQKCLDAGMNDYVSKPFNPDTFEQKLGEWLIKPYSSNLEPKNEKITDEASNEGVWDYEGLLKRVNNKSELVVQLLGIYIKDVPQQIDMLKAAIEHNDIPRAKALVHLIKGIAGNLSVGTLMHQTSSLEDAIMSNSNKQEIERLFEGLMDSHAQILSCFKAFLMKQENEL